MLLTSKAIVEKLLLQQHRAVAALKKQGIRPSLAIIVVGDNEASNIYIKHKQRVAEQLAITLQLYRLPTTTSVQTLENLINTLNNDKTINGLLCQYPLPQPLSSLWVARAISPVKDVDGLHPLHLGLLALGEQPYFTPCTVKAVLALIDHYHLKTVGKKVVMVGRSILVGRPLSLILSSQPYNATVTLCHSRTNNLKAEVQQADILIVAVGQPAFIQRDWLKKDCTVIDAGINRMEGQIIGDLQEPLPDQAITYSPVPGGVGALTVLMLMENVIKAAESKQ